jgi:DNA-binding NtrC family response regulator
MVQSGESTMSTGAEFAGHRTQSEDGRVDEKFVRILFVEDRTDVADEIRGTLGRAGHGSFDVVCETDLVEAIAQIDGETFDLLLLDLSLANVERSTAIELANDLAHRLPVVVLTGTEALEGVASPNRRGLKACVEQADLPRKLLSAIRRSRRLGTGVMSPLFCRIEGLCS